ncbi:phosphatidate cytidylyltransferase [Fodinicola feengrottensis]|uniref:Phosphatidate cytidylyltransferase n=1 Tax=Fodinicola feengrottensis TaxID=435914 RepID=A0ABP4T4R1_9ACTN|nr:phosphatidate cytidylyltransferase [Fodinicola feengrottensis]
MTADPEAAGRGRHRASRERQPSAPKAGRNLPVAIAVGCGLGALVLASLLIYRPVFAIVVAVAVVLATVEMVRAVRPLEARPPLVPLIAGGVGMTALGWFAGASMLAVGFVLTIIAVMLWRLGDGPVGYQRDVTSAALIAAYVPLMAGFTVLLLVPDDGQLRVIAFMATVVCSDTAAYAFGVLFGRHKMAPLASPGKTWEGLSGSLLVCAIAGALFLRFFFDRPWWFGVIYGVAIAIAATLGDLAESMLKRDLGIKDMGSLLPGHGGFMDRLDSVLVAAPVAYVLLSTFAPPS